MAAPVTADAFFDPEFLESLQRLRLVAQRVPRGGRFAEQRSKALGTGLEFQDYRPYSSGDDLRAIDWNIYRRLGRIFLRLFEELEDLPVYLLPDVSRSMWVEEEPRIGACLQSAMAFAAVALAQHDRVGVFPFAEDLSTLVRPRSGWHSLPMFAQALSKIEEGQQTDLATSLKRLNGMQLRSGLVVVLSDFYDPAGVEHMVQALKTVRHRLLLVQLVRPSDRDPSLQGDLCLRDSETGMEQDISITPQLLEKYRYAYDAFARGLTGFAEKRGIGLLQLNVEEGVVEQVAQLFEGGRYEA